MGLYQGAINSLIGMATGIIVQRSEEKAKLAKEALKAQQKAKKAQTMEIRKKPQTPKTGGDK